MEALHSKGRREPAQLSACGDSWQHHSLPQAPSIAPSTNNTRRGSESVWLALHDHPLSHPQWGCAQSSFYSPATLNDKRPECVKISPCPLLLCSSPPNCSAHHVSITCFHLTLSAPRKKQLGQQVQGYKGDPAQGPLPGKTGCKELGMRRRRTW